LISLTYRRGDNHVKKKKLHSLGIEIRRKKEENQVLDVVRRWICLVDGRRKGKEGKFHQGESYWKKALG